MTSMDFREPVTIFVGLGFPYDVDSVWEANRVLNEWVGARDRSHARALRCCRSAMRGASTPEKAREAFEAFASARGIQAHDAMKASASRVASEWSAA